MSPSHRFCAWDMHRKSWMKKDAHTIFINFSSQLTTQKDKRRFSTAVTFTPNSEFFEELCVFRQQEPGTKYRSLVLVCVRKNYLLRR